MTTRARGSDRILTIDEVAEKYKVPKSWVYSRTRQKGPDAIPKLEVGKYIRFIEHEVDEWMRQQGRKA